MPTILYIIYIYIASMGISKIPVQANIYNTIYGIHDGNLGAHIFNNNNYFHDVSKH